MSTHRLPVTIPLWQPWHLRLWARAGAIARAPWQALLPIRRQYAHRSQRQADHERLEALDPRTLRDIGAPEWTIQDAAQRREMAALRIDQFNLWRGV